MKKAVEETAAAQNSRELTISGDGFWQTRGFQSRHGAAAVLSCHTTPKVLDLEQSDPAKYDSIIKSHRCEKNYDKSSGTMESAAILKIFQRSVAKYGVYYTKYIGDGDSKTFPMLFNKAPYPGKVIEKIEDLNHFSTRMKRGLETIKRDYRGKKLSDGKTIGGQNRLSGARSIMKSNPAKYDSIIKSHQCEKNYDKSSGTMESAAILKMFKRSVSNIDWCGYLKSARDGTSYDHTSHAMPRPVLDAIKPVFESLCSSKSLARVVNASSQNANESFHSLVWLMSPKHKASSGITFEIACCLAIIIFYEGYFAIGDVFNAMCGYQGYYTDQAMIHFDNSRLHTESKESNRKKRKQTGHVLLQNNRKEEDSEIIDDIDQTNDDDDDGDPTDKATSEDNDTNPVAEGFDTTSDSDEPATEDNNTTSSDDQSLDDDDYGYYNANDKRKWIEEE
ncbi:unnamed protein product [Rotaria sp. Silwood1]|nr:unnamed protein product [Rotaria sp. Silwood1]